MALFVQFCYLVVALVVGKLRRDEDLRLVMQGEVQPVDVVTDVSVQVVFHGEGDVVIRAVRASFGRAENAPVSALGGDMRRVGVLPHALRQFFDGYVGDIGGFVGYEDDFNLRRALCGRANAHLREDEGLGQQQGWGGHRHHSTFGTSLGQSPDSYL